ncbi:hypothetical protein GR925_27490 [Streptomyces sp. HUCO-GS316]|uniref:hypothetical protein n=1 Tax=Streptomyces sp. HUCO-GS316 TaxID=2692198 RepID=UPI001370CBAE|nr:hypothetical protein [Streptomyces sp. HUCO-GS316]
MTVTVTLNQGVLDRILRRRGGPAYQRLATRTRRVAEIASREAPGGMGARVDWEIRTGPTGLSGVIWCDHPAVHYVLRGTRPHLIRPRRARALHFYVDGSEVFTRLVRHPGTRANPFLQRALRLGR